MFAIVISLLIFRFNYLLGSNDWVVTTEYGDVRGYWSEKQEVWRFVGIPYATPPLGELRYKAPLPPSSWTGIFNATNDNTVCPQITDKDVNISEDCLLIHVFVPKPVNLEEPVPVMFFAHGGIFVSGNGINVYNPQLTTRHGIVLVTFNYRLGPLGYNCFGTDRIPGNAALKDYIAALRWVNSNIARFGGNPNAVTLYGNSVGAMQLHALLLSDKANGLFQQAILESGSVFSYTAFNFNRIAIPTAITLDLGIKHADDFSELQDFLETAPAMDLVNSFSTSVMISNTYRRNDNNLCIEKNLAGSEAVVTENLNYKAASRNYEKVPVLVALNELESMRFSVEFIDVIDELNNNFYKFLPHDIYIPKSEREKVTNEIKSFYFGNKTIKNDHAYNYIVYRSDIQFLYTTYQIAMQYSYFPDNPVYLLRFTYYGGFSRPSDFPAFKVASHDDLVGYIMDLGYYNNVTSKDEEIRDTLTELWTNFVKFGDPTPDEDLISMRWPRFTPDEQRYLKIDQEESSLQQFLHPDRFALWTKIYDRYYYPPPTF